MHRGGENCVQTVDPMKVADADPVAAPVAPAQARCACRSEPRMLMLKPRRITYWIRQ